MKIRILILSSLVLSFSVSSLCAEPLYEERTIPFGIAHRLAKSNQIWNPGAGKKAGRPIYGLEGMAAQIALERYYKSCDQAPPKESYFIPVSGISVK